MSDVTRTRSIAVAALLAVVIGVTGACETDFVGVNENPNAPTDVAPQFILPGVVNEMAEQFMGVGLNGDYFSLWPQHLSRNQYTSADRYRIDPDEFDGEWNVLYTTLFNDVQQMVTKAREAGDANKEAVALILRAWITQNMTDMWGDIPFSQAGIGAQEGGSTAPAYDSQQEIYSQLISDLTSAANMIQPGAGGFESADIVYGGDMEKWRRWANSLRLRLAMRMTEAAPSTAASEAQAAVNAGVFTSASQNAMRDYSGSPPNDNPWDFYFRDRPGDFRMSNTLVDTLKSFDDPRLSQYAATNSLGEYAGKPNGMTNQHGLPFDSLSKVGEFFHRPSTPLWFQTYDEVLFLQAEAAERGYIGGDPAQLYEDAIRAAMRRVGVSSSEIEDYLAQDRVQYDASQGLRQIAFQKWLSLFMQWNEAWAEWRRTGCPVLQPARANLNEDQIPVRVPYPLSEQSFNHSNLNAAVERQGGAGIDTPLWWDTRVGGICKGQTNF